MAHHQSIATRARQAGVSEEEYARNLRAGLEWCSRHRGFVEVRLMSSNIACCLRCHADKQKTSRARKSQEE